MVKLREKLLAGVNEMGAITCVFHPKAFHPKIYLFPYLELPAVSEIYENYHERIGRLSNISHSVDCVVVILL